MRSRRRSKNGSVHKGPSHSTLDFSYAVAKEENREDRGLVLDLASVSTLDTPWLKKTVSSSLFRSGEIEFWNRERGER